MHYDVVEFLPMPENSGYIDMLPSQPVHVNRAMSHDQDDHSAKSMGCQC